MFQRNVLLAVGVIALLAGLMFLILGFDHSSGAKVEKAETGEAKPAILVAAHPIIAGSLLRPEDMAWKELPLAEIIESNLVRGPVSETDFIGAVTRRDFGDREALNSNDIVKTKDRGFLSAVLSPGYRAVSLAVDEAQGVSGLIMPGDRVDIILTQNLNAQEGNAAHKSVGETILHNRRVLAVDKLLPVLSKLPAPDQHIDLQGPPSQRTVTLELTEREAEEILVGTQIGKVALSVRALEGSGADSIAPEKESAPVWASDVSPALRYSEYLPQKAAVSVVPLRSGRALVEIIHGDKTEMR